MSVTNGQVLDELGVSRGFAEHRIFGSGLLHKPADVRPWYVQSAVAVVIWVGAMFFASFLAAIDVLENPGVEIVLGLGFAVAGAVGSRVQNGLLRLHLSLVCYAGVTSLLSVFGDRGLHLRDEAIFIWVALLQLGCLFVFDSRPVRFKATLGASLALLALVAKLRAPFGMELLVVLLAAGTVAWWLAEAGLTASLVSRAVRPVGFALVVATLGAGFFSLIGAHEFAIRDPWFVTLGLGGLLVLVVARAALEAGVKLRSGVVVLALAGAAALTALSSEAPALLAAALVLALGRTRKEPLLDIAGAIGLVLFLVRVYYDLELSLLWTSFALAGAGAAMLVSRAVLLRGEAPDAVAPATGSVLSPILSLPRHASFAVLLPSLLVAVVITGLVARKEQQLTQGQTVLLRLAPVDPRSLLQGDYMTLRYEIAGEVRDAASTDDGIVRVHLDDDRVAVRAIERHAQDERAVDIKWHRVRGSIVFGADSFFFAEGEGDQMARAAFAEVRVTPDGTPVLVRLLDASRTAISP
jgi:uncharacterized membrane-anchored protein